MKYRMSTSGSVATWDKVANQEDEMYIRIFYNGKFVNYLFNTGDVENLGLSNIFDMIDPDPDWIQAKKEWESFGAEREKLLAKPAKKKQAKLSPAP
jgi:hypothetical protein